MSEYTVIAKGPDCHLVQEHNNHQAAYAAARKMMTRDDINHVSVFRGEKFTAEYNKPFRQPQK